MLFFFLYFKLEVLSVLLLIIYEILLKKELSKDMTSVWDISILKLDKNKIILTDQIYSGLFWFYDTNK